MSEEIKLYDKIDNTFSIYKFIVHLLNNFNADNKAYIFKKYFSDDPWKVYKDEYWTLEKIYMYEEDKYDDIPEYKSKLSLLWKKEELEFNEKLLENEFTKLDNLWFEVKSEIEYDEWYWIEYIHWVIIYKILITEDSLKRFINKTKQEFINEINNTQYAFTNINKIVNKHLEEINSIRWKVILDLKKDNTFKISDDILQKVIFVNFLNWLININNYNDKWFEINFTEKLELNWTIIKYWDIVFNESNWEISIWNIIKKKFNEFKVVNKDTDSYYNNIPKYYNDKNIRIGLKLLYWILKSLKIWDVNSIEFDIEEKDTRKNILEAYIIQFNNYFSENKSTRKLSDIKSNISKVRQLLLHTESNIAIPKNSTTSTLKISNYTICKK